MKVLLAVDGSNCSDNAVDHVLSRPWPTGSEIRVLSVVKSVWQVAPERWMGAQDFYAQLARIEHESAEATVKSAVEKLKAGADGSLKITSCVIEGSPIHVIVDESEEFKAELIIVGSHGYGTWNRLLLGSVSQGVSSHASCSVQIVRCHAPSQHAGQGSERS